MSNYNEFTSACCVDNKLDTSLENWDNYIDGDMIEAEESLNNIKFLDAYSVINNYNSKEKMRMTNKILKNYNFHKSIESLCNRYSVEAENEAANGGSNTQNTDNNSNPDNKNDENSNDPKAIEKTKKITNWIKNVVGAIIKALRNFFKLIKDKVIQFSAWINKNVLHRDIDASDLPIKPEDAFVFNQTNFANTVKLVELYKSNVTTLIAMGNDINNENNDKNNPNSKSQEILTKIVDFLKTVPNISIDTGALGSPEAWKKISTFKIDYTKNRNELISFFTGCKKVISDKPVIKDAFGTGDTNSISEIVKKISDTFGGYLKEIEGPFNEADKFANKVEREWSNAPSSGKNGIAIITQRQNVLMCLKMLCRLQETISRISIDVINIVHNSSIRVTTTNKIDEKRKENINKEPQTNK